MQKIVKVYKFYKIIKIKYNYNVNKIINKFVNWEKMVSFIIKSLLFVILAFGFHYLSSILIQYVDNNNYYKIIVSILLFGQVYVLLSLFNKTNSKIVIFKTLIKNNYLTIIKHNLFIYFLLAYFSLNSVFVGLDFLFLNIGVFLLFPLIYLFILYFFNKNKYIVFKYIKNAKNVIFPLLLVFFLVKINGLSSNIMDNIVAFIQIMIKEMENYSIQFISNIKTFLPILFSFFDHISLILNLIIMLIFEYEHFININVENHNTETLPVQEKFVYYINSEDIIFNFINLENEIVIRGPNL